MRRRLISRLILLFQVNHSKIKQKSKKKACFIAYIFSPRKNKAKQVRFFAHRRLEIRVDYGGDPP